MSLTNARVGCVQNAAGPVCSQDSLSSYHLISGQAQMATDKRNIVAKIKLFSNQDYSRTLTTFKLFDLFRYLCLNISALNLGSL